MLSLYAILFGFVLDLCFGDPHWLYHPVRFIGFLIQKTEKILRKVCKDTKRGELFAGVFLVLLVVSISTIIPFGFLWFLNTIHPCLGFLAETIMCYQLMATKALKEESMKVYKKLKQNSLEDARKAVSMIVGRDTKTLDEIGITKATIETVAENTSDGIIAPLFFLFLGGAPLGFLYKSVNTLDSMVGYKNERYMYLGRTAAKLDDILNYIPARISAYLMIVATLFLKLDMKNAYKIYKRDRYKHASPNSAQTEAVCAGALRIQLAGDAYYFGKLYEKEYIGDNLQNITYEDIVKVNQLLYVSAFLALLLFAALKGMFYLF